MYEEHEEKPARQGEQAVQKSWQREAHCYKNLEVKEERLQKENREVAEARLEVS